VALDVADAAPRRGSRLLGRQPFGLQFAPPRIEVQGKLFANAVLDATHATPVDDLQQSFNPHGYAGPRILAIACANASQFACSLASCCRPAAVNR
jgi:hypothetical protein